MTDDTKTDADKLREMLKTLGLSQRECARTIEVREREFRKMCAGGREVPAAVMLAVKQLVHQKSDANG